MVKIKLVPFGKKHARKFRIVVTELREKLTSDPSVVLGFYNPRDKQLTLDREQVLKWTQKGAQATASVRKLLDI